MTKEKRILSYFIGWLILGFIVCFIGVNKIFALHNNNGIWFYDNSGTSATEISTSYNSTINESYANFTTVSNSYGGLVVIQVDKPLIKGHIYTLFINVGAESNGGSTKKSSKNCLGIANSKTGAVNNYLNCSITPEYSQDVGVTTDKGRGLYFTFIANNNGAYLSIPYTTQYTCNNCRQYSYGYNIEDAGNSDNLSEEQVDTIINNQTTEINTNITNMQESISSNIKDTESNITNSITDTENNINSNIDDMESAIVDSNKETQEVIKDQFNNCHQSYNLINSPTIALNKTTNRTLSVNLPNSLTPGTYTLSYKFNSTLNPSARVEVLNGSTQEALFSLSSTGSNTFTIDNTVTRLYFYITNSSAENSTILLSDVMLNQGSSPKKYEPYGEEICSNKIDETNDKLDETNNQLGDLNNNLTDSSPTDMSGLEDSIGWLPPGPVDSILTLPLALFNSLSRNLSNKTCITASLELPFVNKNINLPCVKSLYDKIGITGTLFQTTGIIASCFILFNYLLALYKWVDNTLTLRENTMPGYYDDNWGGGA